LVDADAGGAVTTGCVTGTSETGAGRGAGAGGGAGGVAPQAASTGAISHCTARLERSMMDMLLSSFMLVVMFSQ
jgi:hypothetical protein